MPSMTRGPGRLRRPEPSTANSSPSPTARSSSNHVGTVARLVHVRRGSGVEAARHQHQLLRVHVADALPGRLPSARPRAQQVPAAGAPNLLGHPVAGRERRIEPLEDDHATRRDAGQPALQHPVLDGREPLAQHLDQADRLVLRLRDRARRSRSC